MCDYLAAHDSFHTNTVAILSQLQDLAINLVSEMVNVKLQKRIYTVSSL